MYDAVIVPELKEPNVCESPKKQRKSTTLRKPWFRFLFSQIFCKRSVTSSGCVIPALKLKYVNFQLTFCPLTVIGCAVCFVK